MSLRQQAEQDLAFILEDADRGFAFPATITNPDGVSDQLNVQSGDIHLLYDSDNDMTVSDRKAHVSIRISSLITAGLGIPRADPDTTKNPWLFEFADINGIVRKFIISKSLPDRTLGIVTVILEIIQDA